jgi:hypothetical protein
MDKLRGSLFAFFGLMMFVSPMLAFGPASLAESSGMQAGTQARDGDLKAKGAFTCDFTLPGDFPLEQVGPVIERDRMYMAERPGLLFKHIPLRIDETSGNLLSGGRYLFDTYEQAIEYKRWVEEDFVLDGTPFFDRPYFLNPDCQAWRVIGAHDFAPLRTSQVVLRTERWRVPEQNQHKLLKERWPQIRAEAGERDLSSVWLLYNQTERLVALVYFANRVVPPDPVVPDFASLAALEFAAPLGHHFDDQGWDRYFDRTQWVLTIWFPFVLGDQGEPSLWPYSPPLPEPYCGDGVCEVSRGENHAACPGDCLPRCGDGVCQTGEDTKNCPGDCRLPE